MTLFVVLLVLGVLYCCVSTHALFRDGVFCKPAAPPRTSVWLPQNGRRATTDDGISHVVLIDEAEDGGEAKDGGGAAAAADAGATQVTIIKRLAVIVNPNAGVKAKGKSKLDVCRDVWLAAGIEVDVWETTHAGHLREMARDKDIDGLDCLCVLGGDGSIHELVNGMLARADGKMLPLGLLPGGSGNSIMCDLGTWDLAEAAAIVARGEICPMDINLVQTLGTTAASANCAIWGLVGDIGVIAENFRWMGPGRYNACAVWGLLKGFSQHVVMDVIDKNGANVRFEGDYLTVYINQTQHFGKGMRATPDAAVNDGLMDLTMVKAGTSTRAEMLAVLQQMPDGGHANNPNIAIHQVRECSLQFPEPGVWHLDGEILKHDGTVHVTCKKQILPILADKNGIAGSMV